MSEYKTNMSADDNIRSASGWANEGEDGRAIVSAIFAVAQRLKEVKEAIDQLRISLAADR